jgi:hypothetical protein
VESTIDVVTDRGVPFRVVYGYREYRDGSHSAFPVVSFYDRRYDFTAHGQFVSDYNTETMLERQSGYALCLNGDYADWTIDGSTMNLVRMWLVHQFLADRL